MDKKKYLQELRLATGISSQSKSYQAISRMLKEDIEFIDIDECINFTNRIERKRGFATLIECWSELLTYYEFIQHFFPLHKSRRFMDTLEPEDQFLLMYSYLLNFRNKINNEDFIRVSIYDKEVVIKKEDFYEKA